jgi:hypothetical protein
MSSIFDEIFKIFDIPREDKMSKYPFEDLWAWTTCGCETTTELTCPNCKKKIWVETRFIEPLLPKEFACIYCGIKTKWGYPEDKEEKGTKTK